MSQGELSNDQQARPQRWHQLINLKLAALGMPTCHLDNGDYSYLTIADSLLKRYARQRRLLSAYRCPADQRIQKFLNPLPVRSFQAQRMCKTMNRILSRSGRFLNVIIRIVSVPNGRGNRMSAAC